MSRLLVAAALVGFACLGQVRAAAAQEATEPEPAPAPAPTPAAAPAPAPVPAPVTTVFIDPAAPPPPAGIVQTQRVDTVVVAEPGSHVAVHHAEASPYTPDRTRRGAIIASSIVWGVGALVLGGGYLAAHGNETCTYTPTTSGAGTCTQDSATDWLVAYDLDMAIVPSSPRWAVGDVTGALIFTGLRGASVAAASLVQSDDAFGPVVLGFLVPVTLGVLDLVFTPHRESIQGDGGPRTASAMDGLHLVSLAPAPVTGPDRRVDGGSLHLTASF